MKPLITAAIATGFLLGATSAFAGPVGNVETSVQTGNVSQAGKGMNEENEIELGTVKTQKLNAGNLSTSVKTGDISQAAEGMNNKNKIKMGTVE